MKSSAKIFSRLALPVLCLGLAGCQTQKSTAPVGGGYSEVTRTKRAFLDEPELPRISLEHRGADGKTILVWPALYGASEVIKGELAIFVGDKAFVEPEKVTHPRLFAVTPPGLPLDITDEVLWRWSKMNGKKFAAAMEKFSTVVPEEKNGKLELHLEFWSDDKLVSEEKDWPEQSDLQLEWSQVSEIMRAVKTKGVEQKDLRWHTPYIGEKF
jgi:hypothetical protein